MEGFGVNWKSSVHPVLLCIVFALSAECYGQVASNTVDYGVNPLPFSRAGSAGWQFLKLPTDARSAGMGDMKSAVGFGNANSAFNNPASTADVKDMDVQFTSMTWVADIKYSSVSFVKNLGQWGSIGVSGMYVNYGDMIRTEVAEGFGPSGNSLGIVPITEGLGTFTAHDLALGLVYSRRVTDFRQVGGTVRYCEEQLDDAKMKTWSIDVGTMYWTGIGSLRISMLGKNFGPDGQFLSYGGRIAQSPAN